MTVKVVKTDGPIESYAHTKIIGSLCNAFMLIERPNIFIAEQLAQAITFHIYNEEKSSEITSDSIHLKVMAALNATGYADAADSLNNYRVSRKLRRKRIEVVYKNEDIVPYEMTRQWNKSNIANELIENDKMERQMARVIAASVEEKIFNLEIGRASCRERV